MQPEGGGPIKIGHTTGKSARRRLANLQTGSPYRLLILKTVPGNEVAEREEHRRWSHLRLHGEWFSPGPDLLAYCGGEVGPLRAPNPSEVESAYRRGREEGIDIGILEGEDRTTARVVAALPWRNPLDLPLTIGDL